MFNLKFEIMASGVLAALGALGSSAADLVGHYLSYRGTKETNANNLGIARETNALAEREAERNRQFNAAEAEKNRLWQEEQTQGEREYNDPSRQLERLMAAGINPYFALGSMDAGNVDASSGGATATGSPASFVTGAPMQNPAAAFENLGTSIKDSVSLISGIEKTNAEKRLIDQQGISQEIANDYAHQEHVAKLKDLAMQYRERASHIENNDALRDLYYRQADNLDTQTQFLNDTYELRKQGIAESNANLAANTNYQGEQASLTSLRQTIEKAAHEMNMKFSKQQIQYLADQSKYLLQEIENLKAQKELTDEQRKHEFYKKCRTILEAAGIGKHLDWLADEWQANLNLIQSQTSKNYRENIHGVPFVVDPETGSYGRPTFRIGAYDW